VGVPIDATPQAVADLLAEEGHTRMPVYVSDLDHIVGVLHAKDVIPLLANPALIVLQDLLRKPLWVSWNMPVGALLREMQEKRSHLALIVDEYGGFAGVVSIEDILAEIVGDLPEEHESPTQGLSLGPDGSGLFPAETRIDELNDSLGVSLPRGDGAFETLGGLLNSCAGAIPRTGDRFFVGGLELTVAKADERHVRLVRLQRPLSVPPPRLESPGSPA
jgi:CBS domain containing-hemolysin-like protein